MTTGTRQNGRGAGTSRCFLDYCNNSSKHGHAQATWKPATPRLPVVQLAHSMHRHVRIYTSTRLIWLAYPLPIIMRPVSPFLNTLLCSLYIRSVLGCATTLVDSDLIESLGVVQLLIPLEPFYFV
jgi:hypothetical protein